MRGLTFLAAAAAVLMPADVWAAGCADLLQPASPSAKAADAALVSRVGRQTVSASRIGPVLAEGPWRLVWATPADAERGVFFFRREGKNRYRLVDVWGGVIAPDERAVTVRWIQTHFRSPRRLTGCMVDLVLEGR